MATIVGIDLGTSTTCVAVVKDGEPVVIPGVRGSTVTPSYVYAMEDGRILIGENAKSEVIADPYNTIWATKRLMGRNFNDPAVQEVREKLSYKISGSPKGDILVHARNKVFTPVNVASLILKFVARLASKSLEFPISDAVITVPASFNDLQRKATKAAGEKIGLNVERLVNEPTAAALAWGYHDESDRIIAIYDLGGGTFDVSILAIGHGVYEVLATRGDSWLGGEDFDNRLVDYAVEDFKKRTGVNIYNDKMAHQRVKTAAEKTEIELSIKDKSRLYVKEPCPDMVEMADADITLSRAQFESLVEDLVDRTVDTFAKTLEDAEMDKDDLDNIILVGGVTRIPLVKTKLAAFLGREPDTSINPDEAVAKGAAIHAAALAGERVALPQTSTTRPAGRPKKTAAAKKAQAIDTEEFFAPEPVPLDEASEEGAPGAAVGGPVPLPADESPHEEPAPEEPEAPPPPRSAKAPLLIDVLSQSVGISDVAGLFVPLIKNNSKLPTRVSQVFTTSIDKQEAIRISVYQGEERLVRDKVKLGEFVLRGIEMARRGVPQIKVTFNIDQSGLFTVSAQDLKTNVEKEIVVEGLTI